MNTDSTASFVITVNQPEPRSWLARTLVERPVERRRATRAGWRQLHAASYDVPADLVTEMLPDGSRRWTAMHRRGPCDCGDQCCPRPATVDR
jgi:hypothetical protein